MLNRFLIVLLDHRVVDKNMFIYLAWQDKGKQRVGEKTDKLFSFLLQCHRVLFVGRMNLN